MAQTAVHRRLVRTAAGFTTKARKHSDPNRLSATDLARIYLRDDGRCFYCGVEVDPLRGTFDHMTPFHRGGRNTTDNVVVCCTRCQREKFTMTAQEYLDYRELKVRCPCGVVFKPRAADYRRGYGRYHSRECSGRAGGEAVRT